MRNIQKADLLFAASAVLFAAAFYVRLGNDGTGTTVFYFLAQSAFIGCAADWFAVTALFRKPLGIPFHTALIPRNRGRIIRGIRKNVEERLVRPELWAHLLAGISVTRWAKTQLTERVRAAAEETMTHITEKEMTAFLASQKNWLAGFVRGRAEELPAALLGLTREMLLEKILTGGIALLTRDDTRRGIESALRKFVEDQKKNPLIAFAVAAGESMGVIDYADMTEAIARAAGEKLEAWRHADDPYHAHLLESLSGAAEEFLKTPAAAGAVSFLTETAMRELPLEEKTEIFLEKLSAALAGDGAGGHFLRETVHRAADALLSDDALMAEIDSKAREILTDAALYEHAFLGDAVEDVLTNYDEARLNRFIYTKTDEELGWIRINGALVAAAAGAVLLGISSALLLR